MPEQDNMVAETTAVVENSAKSSALYKTWNNRINDALKREKSFRVNAKDIVQLYDGDKWDSTPYAILYSNTETILPAVYNATPIPMVERRFKDADPVGKMSAEAGTRLLKYLITAESAEYDNFDELVGPAVLDTLLTNRGVTRYKYVAAITDETVSAECVYGEAVRWDKFFHGYARTWKKVPWIGFEWDMTKEEFEENFPEFVDKVDFSAIELNDSEEKSKTETETKEQTTGVKLCKVYEIWDKDTRTVRFYTPNYPHGPVRDVPDPLQLEGFFPTPKPLNFMRKTSTLIPTPLYMQYKQQAAELNDVTRRLKKIVNALKVRGFYNSTIEGIEKVLESEDNVMTPVENMASMPDGSGMDKVLWLMPLAELATVMQNLQMQREQIKNVIYEITGVSDILRGASVASETATAQNIKNQWGTLRLRRMQKEVMRYCRDALRIMLEIAVKRFSVDTISKMTGLPYPTQEQKTQAGAMVQQVQQRQQNYAMMGRNNGPPMPQAPGEPVAPPAGSPLPPPPQIPPQVQEMATGPSWDDVLALLQNNISRDYRIDIETNSTIDAEASQDKQDIADLLNALSQFLNGIGPLIENGTMPFDVAKGIMLAICRRYTFGSQLEDALNQMKPPQPPAAPPPDPAAQAKLAAVNAKAQADQTKAQSEQQQAQLDMQAKQQEFTHASSLVGQKQQMAQLELSIKVQEMELQRETLAMKAELQRQTHAQKLEAVRSKSNAAV